MRFQEKINNLKAKLILIAINLKTIGTRLNTNHTDLNKNSISVKIATVCAAFLPLKLMPSMDADDLLGFVRFNVPKSVFCERESPDFETFTCVSVFEVQRPLNINLRF